MFFRKMFIVTEYAALITMILQCTESQIKFYRDISGNESQRNRMLCSKQSFSLSKRVLPVSCFNIVQPSERRKSDDNPVVCGNSIKSK